MSDTILNIEQGENVSFGDTSLGNIVGHTWEFPGGVPTGSSAINPNVIYTNIGKFDVSLTTEDAYGVFSTNIKTEIINVVASPWGVSFIISENPVLLGQTIDLINTGVGAQTYNEWTFPTDGIISSGITANNQISVNGLKYMNWLTLTGSHSDSAGAIFTGDVKLYATTNFSLGSEIQLMNIKKLGPEEFYYEVYDYTIPNVSYAGEITSSAYGSEYNNFPITGASSIGLEYSFAIDPDGASVSEFEPAIYSSDGAAIYKVNFGNDYANTYWGNSGISGPTGPFYPHVQGERAEIIGRAFSPFNVRNSSYIANSNDIYDALGGISSGKTIGDNIGIGNYTSDIKVPAPAANEIVNPDFALISDNYGEIGVADFDKSYLSHYTKRTAVDARDAGDWCYIPKPTIDKLFEHPIKLPYPNTSTIPTVGITTSADLHLSADPGINNINGYARTYVNTAEIQAIKETRIPPGTLTNVGRYPCIPSQYILPYYPEASWLSNIAGPIYESKYPPMSLRIKVYYHGYLEHEIDVYFGLPDTNTMGSGTIPYIPDSIDINGTGASPGPFANAYGNDAVNGSWILMHNTSGDAGLGVVGYINAYIDDPILGLPGGTGGLIAKIDSYYTLPTPYSDNQPGSIVGGIGTSYPGLSIEIKDPEISKVELVENYGMSRQGGYWDPSFYDPDGNGDPLLMSTPTTWDFGFAVPQGQNPNLPPYIDDPADWLDTPSSYLGISSRIIPFSSGTLGYGTLGTFGNVEIAKSSGIKIGGELKI